MEPPERVAFSTVDGVTLRGDLFLPSVNNAPLIVMTQGLTLLKEHYIPDFARRFQQAGFAALIYDHRGWGSSDGQPRNAVNPMQQAEDYHDAVIYTRGLPGIDASKIAIWGIGHSAGASMIAAGDDPYAKAVVLVMPFFSGAFDAKGFPDGMLNRTVAERERRIQFPATKPTYVVVWDESIEAAKDERGQTLLHGPAAFDFIDGAKKRSTAAQTPWENQMSLESYYHVAKAEPRDHIYKIAPRPMLYLAATVDPISGPIEIQEETFARTGEPKEFVRLDDDHIANYFGESFTKNVEAQIRFLKEYL